MDYQYVFSVTEERGAASDTRRKAELGKEIYRGNSLDSARKLTERGIFYTISGVRKNGIPNQREIVVRKGWRGLVAEPEFDVALPVSIALLRDADQM